MLPPSSAKLVEETGRSLYWLMTPGGLRELTHDSGRRIVWMSAVQIGWESMANGIRCFEGDEVVATTPDHDRAFGWLMTGKWS